MIEEKSSMLDDLDGLTIESAPSSSMLDASALEETPVKKKVGRPRGITPKPPKPPKGAPRQTPEVETLIQRHRDNYVSSRHAAYDTCSLAHDVKAAKAMVKTYGLAKCLQLNDSFFMSAEPFIRDSDYSFGVFKGVVSRMIMKDPVGAIAQMMDLGELS